MIRLRHRILIHTFRFSDQFILIGLVALIYLQSNQPTWPENPNRQELITFILLSLGWIGTFEYFIEYNFNRFESLGDQIEMLMRANAIASVWLIAVFVPFPPENFNAFQSLTFLLASFAFTSSSRLLAYHALIQLRKIPNNLRSLLIIGPRIHTHDIANKIESNPELGYKIANIVDDPSIPIPEIRRIICNHRVDEILFCLSHQTTLSTIAEIINEAKILGIVVRIFSEKNELQLLSDANIQKFGDEFILAFFQKDKVFQLLLKRSIDILISLTLLLLLFPILLCLSLTIKLTSPGPFLFAQVRVGLNQRKFLLFKFRSMVADAEALRRDLIHLNERNGPAFKITNDPRVTPFGRWLRRTSLDELPQLYNVLIGEMSLVGPRPPLPAEVESYNWVFRKRLSVKPGITCIWQVSGRDYVAFDRWMQMDHEYVENWSVWLDLKILLQTIPAVLLRRGAS